MQYIIAFIGLAVLTPVTAHALTCRAVVNSFDSGAEANNIQAIQDSGWERTLFGAVPGGTSGWFLFTDGTRVSAQHNGSASSSQWTVDMESAVNDGGCDVVIPWLSNLTQQAMFDLLGYGSGGGSTGSFSVGIGGSGYPLTLIRDSSTSNSEYWCGPFTEYDCVF
jgi:hypothetical protein